MACHKLGRVKGMLGHGSEGCYQKTAITKHCVDPRVECMQIHRTAWIK